MNYTKLALHYEDQLNLLVSRNLICNDRPRALEWLQRIGYYRLSAYFIPFRGGSTDNFRAGTDLDDVVDLYKFDGNLRLLMMQAMDRIEVAIRAVITYHVAHNLGVFGYADPANFASSFDHAAFLGLIRREERRSAETFVAHYRTKYTSETYLPFWMATELISFGALSKMYANLRAKLRKQIAQEFRQPAPVFLSWLHALTAIRNTCAHHGRLWNRELAVKPELPKTWKAQGIDNKRLYVIALIVQTLLSEVSPDSQWKERLKAHFNAYSSVDLAQMQFPANWQNEEPWL
ncbi:Abi family protein [Tunturiibacter gelidiferens]|uniref:Abi family protein n=1 Tax=Tunturiibacter gelidiferens TaxID=3069689 RepID=UPI003D9B3175